MQDDNPPAAPAESSINAHHAKRVRHRIDTCKQGMPPKMRERMARNLWVIIDQAKRKGVKKGKIVSKAKVGCKPEDVAANELGCYCIKPEAKPTEETLKRLTAKPQNYLKLAEMAAELMGRSRDEAVLQLVKGIDYFESGGNSDEPIFAPAQAIYTTLTAKLNVLEAKYQLENYFNDIKAFSAAYATSQKPMRRNELEWTRQPGSNSVDHWPSVPLVTIARSSAPASLILSNNAEEAEEIDGEVHVADYVRLTLGCDSEGRVVHYLEFQPVLVATWLRDYRLDFNRFTEIPGVGVIDRVRYKLKDGTRLDFTTEAAPDEWANCAHPRWNENLFTSPMSSRFERLTATMLAKNFTESKAIIYHHLDKRAETSATHATPGSILALIEAALLERSRTGYQAYQKAVSFLSPLENEIEQLTKSFRLWWADFLTRVQKDHERICAEASQQVMQAQQPEKED